MMDFQVGMVYKKWRRKSCKTQNYFGKSKFILTNYGAVCYNNRVGAMQTVFVLANFLYPYHWKGWRFI